MKNLILIFILSLSCIAIQAQEKVQFGFKAGFNIANFIGDDSEDFDSRFSVHLGGVAEIPISAKFSFQPELLYSAQGGKVDEEFGDVTFKFDYINLPLLAKFYVAEGFSLEVGPQVGFNINAEADFDGEGSGDIESEKSVVLAAALGLGYKTSAGLFFQGRYNFGISDVVDDGDADLRNGVIAFSVGYFFN